MVMTLPLFSDFKIPVMGAPHAGLGEASGVFFGFGFELGEHGAGAGDDEGLAGPLGCLDGEVYSFVGFEGADDEPEVLALFAGRGEEVGADGGVDDAGLAAIDALDEGGSVV